MTTPAVIEETPLLGPEAPPDSALHGQEHEKVYNRFRPQQKRIITAVVSWSALITFFVSESFVPSIPQVARDLNSTGAVINLAVSLSLLSAAISSLLWATYSSFYGRRLIYLTSLPFLCIGSLGTANAHSVSTLMLWRVLQAFGMSAGISVGAAVLGDIYRVEERGQAMGVFFAASVFGAALAPVVGGAATHYASWRMMQYILFLAGTISLVSTALFLPETSHPGTRGIEKLHRDTPSQTPFELREDDSVIDSVREDNTPFVWVWLNPFASLSLLKSPNLLTITLVAAFGLMSDFTLLIPLSYTIGVRYHITNEALIGAFFMAVGIGNIVGGPIAGQISDRTLTKWRAKRGGTWVPEDRLRAMVFPGATLVPFSLLLSGATTTFVEGHVGVVLNLMWLFMNGIGVDLALNPINAYLVDIMHDRSAEVIAVHKGMRNLIIAIGTSLVLPSVQTIGVLPTNAIAAGIAWLGVVLLWITIRYGERMRAWANVHYTTVATN